MSSNFIKYLEVAIYQLLIFSAAYQLVVIANCISGYSK